MKTAPEILSYCRRTEIEIRQVPDQWILNCVRLRYPSITPGTIAATARHACTNYDHLCRYVNEHCFSDEFRQHCYGIARRRVDGAIAPIVNRLIAKLEEAA